MQTEVVFEAQDTVILQQVDDLIPPGHRYVAGLATPAGDTMVVLPFQCGPVPVVGVNGLTNEALLAVLIHRTEALNARFPCAENVKAIAYMAAALEEFNKRTAGRRARGVEGGMQA